MRGTGSDLERWPEEQEEDYGEEGEAIGEGMGGLRLR